jgi:hypothetical protein
MSRLYRLTMVAGAFVFLSLMHGALADDEINSAEIVAILHGYDSTLHQQKNGTTEFETLKLFLSRLREAFTDKSFLQARFVLADDVADAVRSAKSSDNGDDVPAAVGYLQSKGFSYAITADVVETRNEQMVVQLSTIHFRNGISQILPHPMQLPVYLNKNADLEVLRQRAAELAENYLKQFPELRLGKATYVTCVFKPPLVVDANVKDLVDQLNYDLTKMFYDYEPTLQSDGFRVKGFDWPEMLSKCFGPAPKELLPSTYDVSVTGQLDVRRNTNGKADDDEDEVITVTIYVEMRGDRAHGMKVPLASLIKAAQYEDKNGVLAFSASYCEKLLQSFCASWRDHMAGTGSFECK